MLRTHYSNELSPALHGKKVTVAGWMQNQRLLGGIAFFKVRDRTGLTQAVIQKQENAELYELVKKLTLETVVSVTGVLRKSEKAVGGVEILPEKIEVLNEAGVPLPLDISGKIKSELNTRLGVRFMDLRQEKVRAIFMVRDELLAGARELLDREGFVEMHTPKIVGAGAEGGATLFPVEYFEKRAYLAQSPQLFKQIMMATGFDRVYEVGNYFRAEPSATVRHLAEFTGLDCEMAFISSYRDVTGLVERLVTYGLKHVSKHAAPFLETLGVTVEVHEKRFPHVTHDECNKLLGRKPGTDFGAPEEKKLGEIMKKEYDAPLFFVTEFPVSLKKEIFYIKRLEDGEHTTSFDLLYKGCELVTGNQREHRPRALEKQIQEAGHNPENFDFYTKAFKYGMPPHGGFCLGIDRWVQQLLDLPNIREAVLFPRDRFSVP